MTEVTTTEKLSSPVSAVDETNAVESLLRSCASIRKRTRTCLTITHHDGPTPTRRSYRFPSMRDSSGESARRIREEEETAVELERKILDYRAAMERQKKRQQRSNVDETQPATAPSKAAIKAATQQHRIDRSKLMDESLRQQQEELLLERLAMSQPAIAAAYHSTTTTDGDEHDDHGNQAMKTMIQEASRCRNKQVKQMLETQRKIDEVRRQLTLELEKGRQLQQDNQALWRELQQLKEPQRSNPSVNDDSPEVNRNTEEKRLAVETLILKRALLDIIAGSDDLDWYNDERLRETLLRLEH